MRVCAPAQVAEATPPCASLGQCSSRQPSTPPSLTLALVPQVETGARSAGWAEVNAPDNKLSEDIVKFSMGCLGKRITNALPGGRLEEQGMFPMAVRVLPPSHRPLSAAPQAAQKEGARLVAVPHHGPAWLQEDGQV